MGLTMSSLQLSHTLPTARAMAAASSQKCYISRHFNSVSLDLAHLLDQLLTRAMASPMLCASIIPLTHKRQ